MLAINEALIRTYALEDALKIILVRKKALTREINKQFAYNGQSETRLYRARTVLRDAEKYLRMRGLK